MRLEHDMARERNLGQKSRMHQLIAAPTSATACASASICARSRAEDGACIEKLGSFRRLAALSWDTTEVWVLGWWANAIGLNADRGEKSTMRVPVCASTLVHSCVRV